MCYKCSKPLGKEKIFRSSLCPQCGAELKVCLNCRFYKAGAHWDCHESIPEPVMEKDRANFCGYFEGNIEIGTQEQKKDENVKSQFDALFGN